MNPNQTFHPLENTSKLKEEPQEKSNGTTPILTPASMPFDGILQACLENASFTIAPK